MKERESDYPLLQAHNEFVFQDNLIMAKLLVLLLSRFNFSLCKATHIPCADVRNVSHTGICPDMCVSVLYFY